MWDLSNQIVLTKKSIMDTFWQKVAGKSKVRTGNMEYIRPLGYKTDIEEIIVNPDVPILNLKGNRLPAFEETLTEYVQTFFSSELYWANPISSCNSQEDKLVHAMSVIWLNATADDYENPIQFLKRYTDFLKDKTFDEFWNPRQIQKIQTLQNCSLEISKSEQQEFQETPTSIKFRVHKDNVEKELPRIAYGISKGTAYIYGIQSPQRDENTVDEPSIKKVNRSRFKVNDMTNIPEDYQNVYKKQEPYAYISLFVFLSMLKQKNINRVIMPAYLPERYESKEQLISEKAMKKTYDLKNSKDMKNWLGELAESCNDHQRVQYNITNKFLSYMSRMECDVPGIEIKSTPDETNGSLIVDISKMNVTPENNLIFYELYKKVESLMQTRNKSDEGR